MAKATTRTGKQARAVHQAQPKQPEQAMVDNALQGYTQLLNHSTDLVQLMDAQGTILYQSPAIVQLLGYSPEERKGHNAFELLHPEDKQQAQTRFQRLVQEPGSRTEPVELRLRHKDGSYRWLEYIGTNLLHMPELACVLVNCHDITWRKEAELAMRKNQEMLEQRVAERTQALQQANSQLEQEIRERRQTATALEESEQLYRTLVELSNDAVLLLQSNGNIEFISTPGALLLGAINPGIIMGYPLINLVAEEHHTLLALRLRSMVEGRNLEPGTISFIRLDGKKVQLELSGQLIQHRSNKAILLQARDVTDRQQAAKRLLQAERKYRDIYEHIIVGIFQSKPDGSILSMNPAMLRMLGYASFDEALHHLKGKSSNAYADPSERVRLIEKLHAQDSVQNLDLQFLRKDGSRMWVTLSARMVRNEKGEVEHTEGSVIDISERKQAERKQRKSQALLAEAQAIARIGSWEYDLETREMEWSAEMVRIFGAMRRDAFSDPLSLAAAVHPDDRALYRRTIDTLMRYGGENTISFRVLTKDDQVRWLEGHARTSNNREGKPRKLIGIVQDITTQKNTLEELARSENRIRTAVEKLPLPALYREGSQVYFNRALEALIGFSSAELPTLDELVQHIFPTNRELQNQLRSTGGDKMTKITHLLHRKDGSERLVDVMVFSYDHGEIWFVSDQTENQAALQNLMITRSQLMRAHKLARLCSYLYDFGNDTWTATPEFFQIFGIAQDSSWCELTKFLTLVLPEYHEPIRQGIAHALETGGKFELQYRAKRQQDGLEIWLHEYGEVIIDKFTGKRKLSGTIQDISKQKEIERNLAEGRNFLHRIVAEVPGALLVLDIQAQRVHFAGGQIETMTGFAREVYLRHWQQQPPATIHPADTQALEQALQAAALGQQQVVEINYREQQSSGTYGWRQMRLVPFGQQTAGQPRQLLAFVQDISQQRHTENALRQSERRFRRIFEHSPVGIVILNEEGMIADANQTYYQLLGLELDELRTEHIQNLTYTEDWPTYQHLQQQLLRKEIATFQLEKRLMPRTGVPLWVRITATLLQEDAAGPSYVVVLVEDVKERKRVEEALRRSERRFRTVFKSIPIGLCVTDEEGIILEANPELNRMFGTKGDALVGKRMSDFLAPGEQTKVYENRDMILAGEIEPMRLERRYVRRNGDLMWGRLTISLLPENVDSRKKVMLLEDITQRKLAENALAENEARFRNLVHNSNDVIMVLDDQVNVLYVSDSVEKVLGYAATELVNQSLLRYVLPEDIEKMYKKHVQVLGAGGSTHTMEFRLLRKDGSIAYIDARATNQLGVPSIKGIVLNLRDIAESVLVMEQLRQSLQEKEVLLQEIYHRVKNNLQVVSSLLEMQSDSTEDTHTQEILRDSQNRIYSIALVHERLYQSSDLHRIDLAEYIESITDYIRQTFSEKQVQVALELAPIKVDIDTAMRCGLVLNELLANTMKYAFPGRQGGNIRIQAVADENGNLHKLAVADDGVGIREEINFQNSNSLGLRLIGMIARQLNAEVIMHPGQGTHIELLFK